MSAAGLPLPGLLQQLLSESLQFLCAFPGSLRISRLQVANRTEHDLRHNQSCVLLVVCGHDIPWSERRARPAEALLIGKHILLPEFALLHVGFAELPVLLRGLNSSKETFRLFLLGDMQEEFDDPGAIAVEVPLQ